VSLAACGGNNPDAGSSGENAETSAGENGSSDGDEALEAAGEDFVWFSSVVPDGFEVRGPNGNYGEIDFYQDIGGGNEAIIKVSFGYGDIEEKLADQLSSDRNTQGSDLSAGLYTWSTVDFDWNGLPSRMYLAQMTDKYVVYITGWCIAPDDSDILAVLDSFKPHDDVEDKLGEAINTSFPR